MINPNSTKEKRAKLIADAKAILDKGELTPEDRAALDKMHTDAKAYGEDVERIERQNEMEMKNAPTFQPVNNDPDRKDEKRRAVFKYVREGRSMMSRDERALVEDTAGIVMIPEDMSAEIYMELPKKNPILSLARTVQTSADKVAKRTLTEAVVGWGKLETGALIAETTLVPGKDYIHVEDLPGLVKIGRNMLGDTDANLANLITNSFARAIAKAERAGFIGGRGHDYSEPDGVTLDPTVISTYTDLATPDTIVPDDVINLQAELPEEFEEGAVYMWNKKTEAQLLKVKATANYLWAPNLQTGVPRNFQGTPVYHSGDMIVPTSTNTDRSIVALLGDWNAGYVIVERQGMSIQRLDELYAESGLIGFLVYFRVGGGVVRPDAFRALNNNT